jgi:tetratricopeptide (TPR) repeat protein
MLLLPVALFSLSKSELKYLEANAYMRSQQYEKALALYNDAISSETDYLPAWQMKYVIYDKLGKKADADASFNKMLELKNKNMANSRISAQYIKASGLANTGHYESSLAAFKEAFKNDLGRYTPLALFEMSDVLLFGLSRFGEAETGYEKSLKIDPINEFGWANMGYAQAKLGGLEKALSSFESAIKLNDKNPYYWQNEGVLLISLKRYDESIAALDRCIALNDKNPDIWSYKGQALEALNKKDEAAKCFAKEKELRGTK